MLTIPQIIALTIILLLIALNFKKGTDLLSPAKVFLLVWSVCILLVEFKFSGFQHQWTFYSWLVFLLGLISLLLGLFFAYVINTGKSFKSLEKSRTISPELSDYDLQKMFYIILILFSLYSFAFITEVLIEGNLPIFSPRIDRARIEFGVFGLHIIVNFQLAIMFLAIEYVITAKVKRIKKIFVWSIFFITLISFALLLQRFNFFIWAIMTIGLLYYCSWLLKFRRVLFIILAFFAFLGAIQSIRLSQYVSQYIYVISKMKFPKEYAFFTEPYMYICMNLENMARAVQKLEIFTFGIMTFDSIHALFGLKHWIIEYFNINPKPFLISSYNTFSFHWYYYQDFGILGIVLLPLFTGYIIGFIYYKMRISVDLKWVVMYSICLAILVISFFTNPLTLLNFVVNFIILWLIHHFLIKGRTTVSLRA